MRLVLFVICAAVAFNSCKNNGQKTATAPKEEAQPISVLKDIIVDSDRAPAAKPDFEVLEWTSIYDTLHVVVRYSGGCEEHEFNAYFSGAWLKSLPPQAMVEIEHLNPKNDPCRSLVKDTLLFNLTPLRYEGSDELWVKLASNPGMMAKYHYGKKKKRK